MSSMVSLLVFCRFLEANSVYLQAYFLTSSIRDQLVSILRVLTISDKYKRLVIVIGALLSEWASQRRHPEHVAVSDLL